jgi:hypothetical protein
MGFIVLNYGATQAVLFINMASQCCSRLHAHKWGQAHLPM